MNIFLNEYFGFCFELNFELNHFWAKFNEKMNFRNVSNRARAGEADLDPGSERERKLSGEVIFSKSCYHYHHFS